jgi:DNA polymerase I-like protein with 3'-5' exonuclease and polymerase domains
MIEANYQLITNADSLRAAAVDLSRYQVIGLDTETTDLDPYRGKLRLVQLATPDIVYIVDLFAFDDVKQNEDLKPLRDIINASRPVKIAHNAKFDAKWLKHHLDVEVGGIFDTLLASQIISAGDTDERHNLEACVARYLSEALDKSQRMSDWGGALSESQLRYATLDAAVMIPLREKMVERLKADALIKCAQLEFECVMPMAGLELAGFFLDATRWREQLEKVTKERARLADELQEMLVEGALQGSLFGRAEINLDSHTQLMATLKRMGVPLPETTRNWQLQPLAKDYPVVAKLLEYRTVQKALTSYGENILEEISPRTGRIHANFHQIGAPTGRMACNDPNLQQVPHGIEYRRCFRAPQGRKLITADYSQIELRILAEFSKDEGFMEAFKSGADLHKTTAAQVFNVAPEEVTSEQRSFSKRLNFGVVYGIGAPRFATMTGVSTEEAEGMMRRYFATYPRLDAWLRNAGERAARERQTRTASGRLIKFRFDSNDRQQIAGAKRNGMNAPIQGTSADIFKRALHLLHNELRDTSACIVNVVHDEIVVEANELEAEEVAQRVERSMVAAGEEYVKTVPIKVETEIKDEWVK